MQNSAEILDPQKLLGLLDQQRGAYMQLLELAQQQRSLISGSNPEQLMTVLRQRQNIVGELAQLNMQLAPYRQKSNGTYAEYPAEIRKQANERLSDINGMLQKILKADREDGALLSARKAAVAAELNAVNGGQAANAAYAAAQKPQQSGADLNG